MVWGSWPDGEAWGNWLGMLGEIERGASGHLCSGIPASRDNTQGDGKGHLLQVIHSVPTETQYLSFRVATVRQQPISSLNRSTCCERAVG